MRLRAPRLRAPRLRAPRLRAPRLRALLALALLCAAAPGTALVPGGPGLPGAPEPVEGLLLQHDADGGRSLRGLIDDATTGTYAYTRVDLRGAAAPLGPLAALLQGLPAGGAGAGAAVPPADETGVYEHRWQRGSSAMLTLGAYAKPHDGPVLRVPVVLLENVTAVTDPVRAVAALAGNDLPGLLLNVLPFAFETVEPSLGNYFLLYPMPGTDSAYADRKTIYAWLVRKALLDHEAWAGLYVDGSGGFEGSSFAGKSGQGAKTIGVGLALRTAQGEVRPAGAWLRSEVVKDAGPGATSQELRSRLTVGLASPAGEVPLAGWEGRDDRADADGDLVFAPDAQDTGFSVGVFAAGAYTPLLGVRTTATSLDHACPGPPAQQPAPQAQCHRVDRLTAAGVWVAGEWQPLAGLRYQGNRNAPVPWVHGLVRGGGPGAANMGDGALDAGVFVLGDFQPLAGVRYDDRFAGGQRRFQGLLSAGVHRPQGYVPLAGAAYDGDLPLLAWAGRAGSGEGPPAGWTASLGAFVGHRYVPAVGARHDEADTPQGRSATTSAGIFAGSHAAYVPLVAAATRGEGGAADWAGAFATTGTLGGAAGGRDLHAGPAGPLGAAPGVAVRFRPDYGAAAPRQGFVEAGLQTPGGFVPLAGASYSGSHSLAGAATAPQDAWFQVTAGAFVGTQYVPAVRVRSAPDGVSVALLPVRY